MFRIIERLIRLPEEVDDIARISRMAGFYEISEWDLFRKAYQWWFGRLPSKKLIDKAFSAYLIEGEVPFYVREFVRRKSRQCLFDSHDVPSARGN